MPNIATYILVSLIPHWEDQCERHRMARMTGSDCAVMCKLIIHKHILTPVEQNDSDDRAGLRGYVQFDKYTHTHTNQGVYRPRGKRLVPV